MYKIKILPTKGVKHNKSIHDYLMSWSNWNKLQDDDDDDGEAQTMRIKVTIITITITTKIVTS